MKQQVRIGRDKLYTLMFYNCGETEEQLRSAFSKYGDVAKVKLVGVNLIFLSYYKEADAQKCLEDNPSMIVPEEKKPKQNVRSYNNSNIDGYDWRKPQTNGVISHYEVRSKVVKSTGYSTIASEAVERIITLPWEQASKSEDKSDSINSKNLPGMTRIPPKESWNNVGRHPQRPKDAWSAQNGRSPVLSNNKEFRSSRFNRPDNIYIPSTEDWSIDLQSNPPQNSENTQYNRDLVNSKDSQESVPKDTQSTGVNSLDKNYSLTGAIGNREKDSSKPEKSETEGGFMAHSQQKVDNMDLVSERGMMVEMRNVSDRNVSNRMNVSESLSPVKPQKHSALDSPQLPVGEVPEQILDPSADRSSPPPLLKKSVRPLKKTVDMCFANFSEDFTRESLYELMYNLDPLSIGEIKYLPSEPKMPFVIVKLYEDAASILESWNHLLFRGQRLIVASYQTLCKEGANL